MHFATTCFKEPPLLLPALQSLLAPLVRPPFLLTEKQEAVAVPAHLRLRDTQSVHRLYEAPPCRPLWCALVTRVVKLRAPEAQCDGARTAIGAELDKIRRKTVWDENDVKDFEDVNEEVIGFIDDYLEKVAFVLDQQDARLEYGQLRFQGNNIDHAMFGEYLSSIFGVFVLLIQETIAQYT